MDDTRPFLTPDDLQHDFHVETLIDEFVASFGGKRVDSLISASPAFSNADYLFEADNVVAELKCLQSDFAAPEVIERKENKFYWDWLRAGSIYPEMVGKPHLLPRALKRKLRGVYTEPLRRTIRTANVQLRDTATHFGKEGTGKLLLIANDGAYSANAAAIIGFVCDVLLRGSFSSVEGFVYLTVNRYVSLPGDDYARHLWFPLYSASAPDHLAPFVNRLGEAWYKFLGDRIGGMDDYFQTDSFEWGTWMISNARHIEPSSPKSARPAPKRKK